MAGTRSRIGAARNGAVVARGANFAERDIMEMSAVRPVPLLRFDAGRPDHLAPLFCFLN